MWDVNLLYTAVTRGKKRVILVGERKTLFFSVANFRQNTRITGLKDEIIKLFNPKGNEIPEENKIIKSLEMIKEIEPIKNKFKLGFKK
jgi:hypothetical protein